MNGSHAVRGQGCLKLRKFSTESTFHAGSSRLSSDSYSQGYVAGQANANAANASAAAANANAAAANANAAAANANAGATNANHAAPVTTTANINYEMGGVYYALPTGCIMPSVSGGGTYYLYGNTWFSPAYGASGVY